MSSAIDPADYHQRLAHVREYLELSQEKMAGRLGISLRAYANYERGERAIPIDVVRTLLEKCAVDPVWLLTGEGGMLLDRDVRFRLDQRTLEAVTATVARIEKNLDLSLATKKKARLIGLLYEQCQLLGEDRGDILADARVDRLTRSSR
ncbi:TPA: helix-turn-helix transcriptional regulator [Burkholderia vietnamiensis]|uniref:helix-turn-helix domain-containing protein n=1 Tax=Burkholderia vietnamiensis TaxID=60552 RepID=UPI001B95C42C|nr:helix-turn-helix transcriptional regulator [Burkholderia vietnamiensis]MBR7913650.1 helix-turn-helix transcriptional regulator [Burkholderia vietnamiensis]HDR9277859.1 helix-turn-helix transcriptional regulator [Burkholderia vietnamiensis]